MGRPLSENTLTELIEDRRLPEDDSRASARQRLTTLLSEEDAESRERGETERKKKRDDRKRRVSESESS